MFTITPTSITTNCFCGEPCIGRRFHLTCPKKDLPCGFMADTKAVEMFLANDLIYKEEIILPVCNFCHSVKFDTGKKKEWSTFMTAVYRCRCEADSTMYLTPNHCEAIRDNFRECVTAASGTTTKTPSMPSMPSLVEYDGF